MTTHDTFDSNSSNPYCLQVRYTVVSAVYNASDYLDDFFKSILAQTTGVENLSLILVDDGSTDDSRDVIERWSAEHPELITLLRKENGGQGSARNLGMRHVKTEWVTFIDPDDFVSEDYFEEVDRALRDWEGAQLVSCNQIFFYEANGEFMDTHPLRTRFERGGRWFAVGDENMYPQLSMASCFFRMSEIRAHNLAVDEAIKPSFEDAHFVNRYLLALNSGLVGFLPKPRYYYRKRKNQSSTLDKSWRGFDKLRLLRIAHYDLVQKALDAEGYVPRNIQTTLLYELAAYFKHYLGKGAAEVDYSQPEELSTAIASLRAIFECIDIESVYQIPGGFMSYPIRQGICRAFYEQNMPFSICYLLDIDYASGRILAQSPRDDLTFYENGLQLTVSNKKRAGRSFLGAIPFDAWVYELPLPSPGSVLSFRSSDRSPVRFSVRGKLFQESVSMRLMGHTYCVNWKRYEQDGDYWLLADADDQADADAEHLYRWIMKNRPHQECFFVLKRSSKDWQRLAKDGFKLIDYESEDFEERLKHCSKIISSQLNSPLFSYFGDRYYGSKDLVLLRHEEICEELPPSHDAQRMTLICTTSANVKAALVDEGTPYFYLNNDVAMIDPSMRDTLFKRGDSARSKYTYRAIEKIGNRWSAWKEWLAL